MLSSVFVVGLQVNENAEARTGATGGYSTGAVNINLYTGWNFVSYSSATSRLASTTLPGAAYLVTEALPTAVTFSEGNAYWVHVTADVIWNVGA